MLCLLAPTFQQINTRNDLPDRCRWFSHVAMSNLDDFSRFCTGLADNGFQLHVATYRGDAMGSWHIELSSKVIPKHRLIWEASDQWLILQSQRPERERTVRVKPAELHQMSYLDGKTAHSQLDEDAWKDKWIGRETAEQTLDELIRRLP